MEKLQNSPSVPCPDFALVVFHDGAVAVPGERLILTFETEKTVLDMKVVERLVNRYLV